MGLSDTCFFGHAGSAVLTDQINLMASRPAAAVRGQPQQASTQVPLSLLDLRFLLNAVGYDRSMKHCRTPGCPVGS